MRLLGRTQLRLGRMKLPRRFVPCSPQQPVVGGQRALATSWQGTTYLMALRYPQGPTVPGGASSASVGSSECNAAAGKNSTTATGEGPAADRPQNVAVWRRLLQLAASNDMLATQRATNFATRHAGKIALVTALREEAARHFRRFAQMLMANDEVRDRQRIVRALQATQACHAHSLLETVWPGPCGSCSDMMAFAGTGHTTRNAHHTIATYCNMMRDTELMRCNTRRSDCLPECLEQLLLGLVKLAHRH